MSFEVVARGTFAANEALPEGTASIAKSGKLTCRQGDLALVGVGSLAVVLADRDTFRVGLRAPRPGEEALAMRVTTVKASQGRATDRRGVNIGRAIRALAITPEAAAGRYPLKAKGEAPGDALLIVNVCDVGAASKAKKAQ